jgi:hypothetical protein
MGATPRPDEVKFVEQRTRALVRGQRPRLHKFVGYVPPAPVNTTPPAVTGVATVGSNLTCSTGVWTGSPTSYTYAWYRGAVPIAGATNAVYALVGADSGNSVSCRVTAHNAGGQATQASNAVAVT